MAAVVSCALALGPGLARAAPPEALPPAAAPAAAVPTEADEEIATLPEQPNSVGPFYGPADQEEIEHAIEPVGGDKPFGSVADGAFCFVESSRCRTSLILWADVGAGFNAIQGDEGFDVPYTQVRLGGGYVVRPLYLARRQWHPWGLGLTGSWSLGSGSVLPGGSTGGEFIERDLITAIRIGALNQIWLSQKRHALHADITLGVVNSTVFKAAEGRFWGTNAEFGLGFGGWGGVFVNADFLDQDTRVIFGFKGHAIAAAPVVGLILAGLAAGGASLAAGGGG